MATNVINMRRFVDVTTGVQQTPANVARDWGAYLFVQKGQDSAATQLTKYDDLDAVIAAGSNTEAAKAATVFYGTGYNGVKPNSPFYVAVIGAKDAEEFQTNFTALMGSENYYLIGLDSNFEVAERKAAAAIVEATQTNSAHKLFVEDYSADAANKPLGTALGAEDVKTMPSADVSTLGKRVHYIGTTTGSYTGGAYYECVISGPSTYAWQEIQTDGDSLGAYCKNNKYTASFVVWVNPTNENKYYGAAAAAFFATRQFASTDRRMASIAHKAAQGISPIDLTDAAVTVSPTQAFDNLDAKHCNVYANIKIVGLPAWERGNVGSGDDASDYISADYLNYTIAVSVFNALQINPRIPMNNDGAVILASAIELGFERLNAAGVIAGGVSLDGESFPATGYKISIPIPTGVARANGLWENINCSALLAGSAKKVVIGNTLKR